MHVSIKVITKHYVQISKATMNSLNRKRHLCLQRVMYMAKVSEIY